MNRINKFEISKLFKIDIRRKTLSFIGISFFVLIACISILSITIFRNNFIEIEKSHIQDNTNRVRNFLNEEINFLNSMTHDWAVWDDTYYFINDRNQAYIASNLTDEGFTNLKINLMVFTNANNEIVYEKYFDYNNGVLINKPENFNNVIIKISSEIINKDDYKSLDGLIQLDDKNILLLSAQPIIKSDVSGPINGTLIFGKFFDDGEIFALSENTNLEIEMIKIQTKNINSDTQKISSEILDKKQDFIEPISIREIQSYFLVNDIFGNPIILIKIIHPRSIYVSWIRSTFMIIGIMSLIGIIFTITASKYLDKILLKRVVELSKNVRNIALNDKKHIKLPVTGNDELTLLANDINYMLEKINKSYYDYLTGLYNRSFFEEEIKRLDTERQLPISIIIGDVNGLKLINDTFGHIKGDKLLCETAKILKKSARKEDIVSRWGGDEFIIFLPKTKINIAQKIIERIKINCQKYNNSNNNGLPVSIAFGISEKIEKNQNIDDLIKNAEDKMYRHKLMEQNSFHNSIITSLEIALEEKDFETENHVKRLKDLSLRIGKMMQLSDYELDELSLLATLHDIGKICIAENILLKPAKLSSEEWELVKKHPEIGYRIASSSPELATVAEAILHHHERWDGKGYLKGLKGEEIPLLSRIIAIVDSFDAMTNDRPYRKSFSIEEALVEIEMCSGTQFDPKLVESFMKIVRSPVTV